MTLLVSVCIPTCNRADLIGKTLDALISQLTPEMEIIVSDNASSDDTAATVSARAAQCGSLRGFRNDTNIGLDANTIQAVRHAQGEYCWLLSDDDIVLPGAVERIIATLKQYRPPFVYLHFSGFLEHENYTVVRQRDTDVPDVIYDDPEKMMRELLLNHFSASIVKRDLALLNAGVVDTYRSLGFERGYSLVINHYVILANPGPYPYIGKLCVAVRNTVSASYNPLTTLTDTAHHYQILREKGLISPETEEYVLNWFIRGFYHLVLPMRVYGNPSGYCNAVRDEIIVRCARYKTFYTHLYWSLALPRWSLVFPYWMGRKVKSCYRALFNASPFS